MINLHERMWPTSAGVKPATSWSPVRPGKESRRVNIKSNTGTHHLPIVVGRPVKGYLANSADPDQMPQNAASDQGLHCLQIL